MVGEAVGLIIQDASKSPTAPFTETKQGLVVLVGMAELALMVMVMEALVYMPVLAGVYIIMAS
jgi:hypothetical protein